MDWTMTKSEREAFLAAPRIAVLSVERDDDVPLTCPVWFDYSAGGDLRIMTTSVSKKGQALAAARRCSICVTDDRPPYTYVVVEGAVTAIEPLSKESYRPMTHRYLGATGGDLFTDATATPEDIVVHIAPQRWLTADFRKVFGTVLDDARPE